MGQRTQILVIKESNKGEKKNYFFHSQWGYGRVMYLALMDLVMQDYFKEPFEESYNFLNCKFGTNTRVFDVTDEVPSEVIEKADINDFSSITDVYKYGDNNNGGLVVHIKEGAKEYDPSHIQYGFLLGGEDEVRGRKAFSRWLSAEEYGKWNGGAGYSDKEFVKMFMRFCKYFEVADIAETVKEVKDLTEQFLSLYKGAGVISLLKPCAIDDVDAQVTQMQLKNGILEYKVGGVWKHDPHVLTKYGRKMLRLCIV